MSSKNLFQPIWTRYKPIHIALNARKCVKDKLKRYILYISAKVGDFLGNLHTNKIKCWDILVHSEWYLVVLLQAAWVDMKERQDGGNTITVRSHSNLVSILETAHLKLLAHTLNALWRIGWGFIFLFSLLAAYSTEALQLKPQLFRCRTLGLRQESLMGIRGVVLFDCGELSSIWKSHHQTNSILRIVVQTCQWIVAWCKCGAACLWLMRRFCLPLSSFLVIVCSLSLSIMRMVCSSPDIN